MDETQHLLSSLEDHLDAAKAKSVSSDVDSDIEHAQSITADLASEDFDPETDHERVETLLDLLEGIADEGTGNPEADSHVDAARRAGERVLDR